MPFHALHACPMPNPTTYDTAHTKSPAILTDNRATTKTVKK